MIGEALGNYRLVSRLGGGSMGVVFLGEHLRIARRVAIKVLIPELSQNEQAVRRFFNEALATSLIRHPGIVEVFDCDLDACGRAYIVMEHLEGETLADRLRKDGPLPWPAACAIAGRVADAIGAAHDKAIVHRDLKPENVFLLSGDPPPVKVLDFGVAKLLAIDATAARLTIRGAVMGTPEYMSPEQCGGSEEVDHRADIYALGCILFEMLSGRPPFVRSSLHQLLTAHMHRAAPPLTTVAPGLPAWLGDLVGWMLSKGPEERPSSMVQVARLLAGDEPVSLRPSAPAAPSATEVEAPPRGRRHVRRTQVALAIAGALAVGSAAWTMVPRAPRARRDDSSAAQPAALPVTATLPPAAPPDASRRAPTAEAVAPRADTPVLPPPKLERARRPARTAVSRRPASAPAEGMDTDGIVDL